MPICLNRLFEVDATFRASNGHRCYLKLHKTLAILIGEQERL